MRNKDDGNNKERARKKEKTEETITRAEGGEGNRERVM